MGRTQQLATLVALLAVFIGVGITHMETRAAYTSDIAPSFPEGVTITGTFPGTEVIADSVTLVWRPSHGTTSTAIPASIEPSRDGTVTATAALDFQTEFVPAGITIEYQWQTGSSPLTPLSDPESFDWFDSRWDWRSESRAGVTVHTYGDGTTDAASILASATDTLDTMRSTYGIELDLPVQIWAYPSMTDFIGTQQANAPEAVAGVAYPEYGVISAILPVGQPAEVDRVIPHEVAHQVLAQATDNSWNYPPLWFGEGLAVYLQTGGTASYRLTLDRLANEGGFFELDSLSAAFPYTPAEASIAYGQSWSVVTWLHERYGADGVARLIAAFGSGVSWDEAIRTALDTDISTIEQGWHVWLQERSGMADARLVSENIGPHDPGNPASTSADPQQEIDQWPLRPVNSIVQRSSIQRRSSASLH